MKYILLFLFLIINLNSYSDICLRDPVEKVERNTEYIFTGKVDSISLFWKNEYYPFQIVHFKIKSIFKGGKYKPIYYTSILNNDNHSVGSKNFEKDSIYLIFANPVNSWYYKNDSLIRTPNLSAFLSTHACTYTNLLSRSDSVLKYLRKKYNENKVTIDNHYNESLVFHHSERLKKLKEKKEIAKQKKAAAIREEERKRYNIWLLLIGAANLGVLLIFLFLILRKKKK